MRVLRRLSPLTLLLALGCVELFAPAPRQPIRINTYRSRLLGQLGRQRVLILPFRHLEQEAAQGITEAFALELEKAQIVEVISPEGPAARLLERLAVWNNGGRDIHCLNTLRQQYKVGAVAVGCVTQYRPYDPPVLGLRVQVISTRTGSVLWGAEGCFDAREASVQAEMERFYKDYLEVEGRAYGWKLLLTSPRHYAQFVAHQLVATFAPPRRVVASNPN